MTENTTSGHHYKQSDINTENTASGHHYQQSDIND